MPRVLLVASTEYAELVRYLAGVGFDIRTARDVKVGRAHEALVWLVEDDSEERVVIDGVAAWLAFHPTASIILVSPRSSRLKARVRDPRGRVQVFPAPVFGWQLVDALRDDARSMR